ncbi:MAG: polymorphic toxin-type HINT domain-containing protein, partial [Pirellulaceae bacterium]
AAVIDVSVEGLEEPIGVTVNHPFWSDDRQDFVRADALHIGERLHGLTGSPRITAISPRGPPEPVYNLEVHGEHCYQVTTLGLVVHNTAPAGTCFDGFIRLGDFEDAARRGTRAVSSGGNAPRAKTRLYEVDTYNNLRKNPAHGVLTDTIAEHSPQKKWAQDLIADYSNRGWREPAIRVTVDEAAAITQAEKLTQVPASARDALAIKIRILRHHTNAPNSALHELIQLNKRLHRYDYDPLHRLRQ